MIYQKAFPALFRRSSVREPCFLFKASTKSEICELFPSWRTPVVVAKALHTFVLSLRFDLAYSLRWLRCVFPLVYNVWTSVCKSIQRCILFSWTLRIYTKKCWCSNFRRLEDEVRSIRSCCRLLRSAVVVFCNGLAHIWLATKRGKTRETTEFLVVKIRNCKQGESNLLRALEQHK